MLIESVRGSVRGWVRVCIKRVSEGCVDGKVRSGWVGVSRV